MGGTEHRGGTDGGDLQRRRILQFVQKFVRQEGYSPSYREIGEELGLGVSTVSYHVSILKRAGFLSREDGQPRTIVDPACLGTRAEDDDVEVPLIGQIAAGTGIDADACQPGVPADPWRRCQDHGENGCRHPPGPGLPACHR